MFEINHGNLFGLELKVFSGVFRKICIIHIYSLKFILAVAKRPIYSEAIFRQTFILKIPPEGAVFFEN